MGRGASGRNKSRHKEAQPGWNGKKGKGRPTRRELFAKRKTLDRESEKFKAYLDWAPYLLLDVVDLDYTTTLEDKFAPYPTAYALLEGIQDYLVQTATYTRVPDPSHVPAYDEDQETMLICTGTRNLTRTAMSQHLGFASRDNFDRLARLGDDFAQVVDLGRECVDAFHEGLGTGVSSFSLRYLQCYVDGWNAAAKSEISGPDGVPLHRPPPLTIKFEGPEDDTEKSVDSDRRPRVGGE